MCARKLVFAVAILLSLFGSAFSHGQSPYCAPASGQSNFQLTTDADVANFATLGTTPYVDCVYISGNVSDLSPISAMNLYWIGELVIEGASSLSSLNGLEKLALVDTLEIFGNNGFSSLAPIKGLAEIEEFADITPGSLCKDIQLPFLLWPEVPRFGDRRVFLDYEDDNPIYGSLAFGGVNESCWSAAQATETEIVAAARAAFDLLYPVQGINSIPDNRVSFTVGQGAVRAAVFTNVSTCQFDSVQIADPANAALGALLEIDFSLSGCAWDASVDPELDVSNVIVAFDFGADLPRGTVAAKLVDGRPRELKQAVVAGSFLIYNLWDDAVLTSSEVTQRKSANPAPGGEWFGCHAEPPADQICFFGGHATDNTIEPLGVPTGRYCAAVQKRVNVCGVPDFTLLNGADLLDEDLRRGYLRDPVMLIPASALTVSSPTEPVPALPLLIVVCLGGLVWLLGLRKLRD